MVLQLHNEFFTILRLNCINPADQIYVHTLAVMLITYPLIPELILNYIAVLDKTRQIGSYPTCYTSNRILGLPNELIVKRFYIFGSLASFVFRL